MGLLVLLVGRQTSAEPLPFLRGWCRHSRSLPSFQPAPIQNTSNPKQTHALLQGRLAAAAKLNDQIADIFRERAAIEASYVAALQKFQAKRGAGGGVARETLGGLSSVWEAIWGEVQEVSLPCPCLLRWCPGRGAGDESRRQELTASPGRTTVGLDAQPRQRKSTPASSAR